MSQTNHFIYQYLETIKYQFFGGFFYTEEFFLSQDQSVVEAGFHWNKDTEKNNMLHTLPVKGQRWSRLYLSAPFIILISIAASSFLRCIIIIWRCHVPSGWWAEIWAHLATMTAHVLVCKRGQQPVSNALHRRCTFKAFGHFSPDAICEICGGNISKSN